MNNICKNCGTEFTGAHCPTCGQSANVKRFTVKDTVRGVLQVFVVPDNTFYRTAKSLFTRPGHMVREYIVGERMKYLKPVNMLMLLVALYIIVTNIVAPGESLEDAYVREQVGKLPFLGGATKYVITFCKNKVYMSLLQAVLCTIPLTFVFHRCRIVFKDGTEDSLNIAEHFYTIIYITCQIMIISFIEIPLRLIFGYEFGSTEALIINAILYIWCYKQLLGISWINSIWKIALGFIIMMVSLLAIVFVILVITFIINPDLAASLHK